MFTFTVFLANIEESLLLTMHFPSLSSSFSVGYIFNLSVLNFIFNSYFLDFSFSHFFISKELSSFMFWLCICCRHLVRFAMVFSVYDMKKEKKVATACNISNLFWSKSVGLSSFSVFFNMINRWYRGNWSSHNVQFSIVRYPL